MGNQYSPMSMPNLSGYKRGDVLVLFGELFNRGYANGLVEAAEKVGMTIIYSTVGRREAGRLRPLNADEINPDFKNFVNVPLEAGFDLDPSLAGITPVDQLKDVKLSDWESCKINWAQIDQAQESGLQRFRENLEAWKSQVQSMIPKDANVLFAHLMAGGVPRAKIVMPLMNRAFKGSGDRYLSSEVFWNSEIGRLCQQSFMSVTAETLDELLVATKEIRDSKKSEGLKCNYLAYGYHGTAVLIDHQYRWQTYTPYLQGWAKLKLEDIATKYSKEGVSVCVFNCPEILTNSSSIFQGVEVPLYPLLEALTKEAPNSPATKAALELCQSKLKDEVKLDDLLKATQIFLQSTTFKDFCHFEKWPQHSTKEQMELLLACSDQIFEMHKSSKDLLTAPLSEMVFEACGHLMLHGSWHPKYSYTWINHDIVAKYFATQSPPH